MDINATFYDENGQFYDENGQSDVEYRNFERIMKIAIPIVFAIITLLGVLGNGLVIWTILTNKKIRTPTNLLILNLAVADFLFIVICVPFYALNYVLPNYILGKVWCKMSQYFIYVCACVSIYSLVIMSLVRCIVVVRPLSSRTWVTARRLCLAIAVIWITILGGFSPLLVQYDVYTYSYFDEERSTCLNVEELIYPNQQKLFFAMFFAFGFALPLYMMVILYGILLVMLKCGETKLESSAQRTRSHGHVTKVVIVVVLCFLLCWLPLQVIFMVQTFGAYPSTVAGALGNILANCLAYSNSCINPVLYAFLSSQFRQSLKQAICCGRHSRA